MKLILTREVSGLGSPGDVVEVKDGYGRNYLLPRGYATAWTKGGEKQVSQIKRARDAREIRSLEGAQEVQSLLQAKSYRLSARAGSGGRLFGAVTPADVVETVEKAGGPKLDRRRVELKGQIKTVGSHKVQVKLHPEVTAIFTLEVSPAQ